MRGFPVLAALMASSAPCLATSLAGQDGCDLIRSRSSSVQVTRDGFLNYISEPVFGCAGGVVIHADSAVLDDASGFTRFIGNFEYRDSTGFMTADRADYSASAGRLIGVGNVRIDDEATGASFEGDSAVLVSTGPRREEGELTVVGRDGRRAHAIILASPRPAPDSSETAAQALEEAASDSIQAADSAATDLRGPAPPTDSAAAGSREPTPATDSTVADAQEPTPATDSTAADAQEPIPAADSTAADAQEPTPATDSTAADAREPIPATDSAAASTPDPLPRDTTPVPYYVDARRIHMQGADRMWATGDAELRNDDFRAQADSIEYREESGKLFLRGAAPRVLGYGTGYALSGDAVDMDLDGNQVAARGDADLSGSEINLTAPEIRVLTRGGALHRVVAMNERPPEPEGSGRPGDENVSSADSAAAAAGEESSSDSALATEASPGERSAGIRSGDVEEATPVAGEEVAVETDADPDVSGDSVEASPARPRAVAETFELEGDSIDVRAPNEVLERVVAVGGARGESFARDSLNDARTPDIARSDWISGDTIVAVFRPVPPGADAEPAADGSGGYRLDRLDARGQAATLYRMIASGDADADAGGGDADGEGTVADDEADAAQRSPGEAGSDENALDRPERQGAEGEASGDPAQRPGEGASEEAAAPETDPVPRLSLHYARGDRITILMRDGEVFSVVATGDISGVQLEPVVASPPPPDTVAARTPNRETR